jgi:large subunit ribosomal protein L18
MYTKVNKNLQRERRRAKIRARIEGSAAVPRLSVFRSNKYIYAQLVDDNKGTTLLSLSDKIATDELNKVAVEKEEMAQPLETPRVTIAFKLGKLLATKAKEKKISKIVFDRSGYKYHGRVKALADGARAGGLVF